MKTLKQEIWDLTCTTVQWFALVIAFFIGLFLMGITFKVIANAFLAGYHLL